MWLNVTSGHTRTHTHTHTRARAHTHTHMRACTSSRTRPRHIDDRPSASAALHAPAETAHTSENDVTRAVFHAPMFALKAVAEKNACEPTARGRRRREVLVHSVRMRVHPHTRARTHTHAWTHTHVRVCGAMSASVICSHARKNA